MAVADVSTLAVTYACSILALILIVTRLLCRHIRGERYLAFHDDMWMGFSVLPLVARLGVVHVVLDYGTNSVAGDAGKIAKMSQEEITMREIGSKMVLVSRILYPAFLWCMKACVLAFLGRLMSAEPKYARAINIIWWSLALTFVAVVLSNLLECRPFHMYFQLIPDPGEQCTKALGQLLTVGLTNIVTDIALIALPLPLIFRSHLPLYRKLQLAFLFGVGIFLIIITIIRMPLITDSPTMQRSRTLWASIEIFSACLVANAPILNNFIQEHRRKRAIKKAGGDDDDPEAYGQGPHYANTAITKLKSSHSRDQSEDSLASHLAGRPGSTPHQQEDQGYRLNQLDRANNTTRNIIIQTSTEVTQTETRERVSDVSQDSSGQHMRSSRYYKGDFLGTQIWTDQQIFPGPKDPSQHVKYGMVFNHAHNSASGGLAHHASGQHMRSSSRNITDIPSLGVLPSAPPRALLKAMSAKRKAKERGIADTEGGEAGGNGSTGKRKSFVTRHGTGESEEELGRVSRASFSSKEYDHNDDGQQISMRS